MILVLLGTQNNSFIRLLDEIEKCVISKIIMDEVIVQAGYTKFTSSHMKVFDFISIEDFNTLLDKASLIITHGGVGSIINSIKKGKKVISVPRLSEYNEHVNDHQLQIVKAFDEKGHIKGVCDLNLLGNAITQINDFIPIPYVNNNKRMLAIIADFIENN